MKKSMVMVFLAFVALVSGLYIINNSDKGSTYIAPLTQLAYDITMKQDLLCLMLGYSDFVSGVEKAGNGNAYLVMKSGQKLLYDDKRAKNHEQKMANPDLQDMLEQPYPLYAVNQLMETDFDPGRVRVYGLLKEVYGSSQGQIEKRLGNFGAGGRSFQFNKSNGAGDALKAVMQELLPLAQNNRKVAAAAFPSSGTYNYRVISGTNRLSPHAFGIAIDLARDKRDYWRWATREQGQKRLEAYPTELVEVFERNNFIWGGKWGHFDILHFEYRPEIILKARYFGKGVIVTEPWYKGAPAEDAKVKGYIDMIDQTLK